MKVGNHIICAGLEDMLSVIASMRSAGYKTKQTDEPFVLQIIEECEPNWVENEE